MKSILILIGCLTLGFGVVTTAASAAAPAAATVALITGKGTATGADGTVRALAKGDAVYSGEIVSSGSNSYLNLRFADGGYILLRPRSRFQIEEFHYGPAAPAEKKPAETAAPAKPVVTAQAAPAAEGVTERAFFRLLKGGFRAVSGLIGHVNRDEYRVATPVATIGIRGTDYEVILCDQVCSKDPVVNGSAPNGAALDGVVVGVITGGVFVENQNGQGANLGENDFLLTLPDGSQVTLPGEPKFLKIDPIPNPAACGG